MREIADKYGDDRRTQIGFDDDIGAEDFVDLRIPLLLSPSCWLYQAHVADNFRPQHRGEPRNQRNGRPSRMTTLWS